MKQTAAQGRALTRENFGQAQLVYEEEDEDDDDDKNNYNTNNARNNKPILVNATMLGKQDNHNNHHHHKSSKGSQTCFCDQNRFNLNKHLPPQSSLVAVSKEKPKTIIEEQESQHYGMMGEVTNLKDNTNSNKNDNLRFKQIVSQLEGTDDIETNSENQLKILRDLLRLERENNSKQQQHNADLQQTINRLQVDFLRQQSDLVEALEFSGKLKTQKDSQISMVETTLVEKDRLIEQLRLQLASLDETKLRKSFNETLEKQQQLAKLESEQLRTQINQQDEQISQERAEHSRLLQQLQSKANDQIRLHELEMDTLGKRLAESQTEIERMLSEPQNLIIKSLREDNSKLKSQIDETNVLLDESQRRYENLKEKLALVSEEQEQMSRQNQEESDRMQQATLEQRHNMNELKLELEDKQEVIQILQFNLQRSEKRVKSLIGALKNKEEIYNQLLNQMETQQQQNTQKDKVELNRLQSQLVESDSDLMKKQNELVRLRMEYENQLEIMRNECDERINKCNLDKQRLERDLQSAEMRLVRETELVESKTKQNDQLQKETNQHRDDCKRLLMELSQNQTNLFATQKELANLKEMHKNTFGCLASDDMDAHRQQVDRLKLQIDEERRHSNRYKNQLETIKKDHEKMCVKLRIAESNLIKMTSSINREHARMLRDYEKKLELVRSDQVNFDRNKLRYKRHSHKLKKYCEHLLKVHDHICNSDTCGYSIVWSAEENQAKIVTNDDVNQTKCRRRSAELTDEDQRDRAYSGDSGNNYSLYAELDGEFRSSDETSSTKTCNRQSIVSRSSVNSRCIKSQNHGNTASGSNCKERLKIKRTGLSAAISVPTLRGTATTSSTKAETVGSYDQIKSISSECLAKAQGLKMISTNHLIDRPCRRRQQQHGQQQQQQVDLHKYYYIKDSSFRSPDNRML